MYAEMLTLIFIFICLVGTETADTGVIVDSVVDSVESRLCHQPSLFYSKGVIKCTDQGVLLSFGYCATETNGNINAGQCHYFQLDGHNVSEPGYISLPNNISELNDYVCGPMNRKDFLCKDCIDGFGPSVTSLGYKCSNCTNAWYGIPLYLAVELIPITLFYLIILIFKVHLTSAPMVLFIIYHQLIMYEIVFQKANTLGRLIYKSKSSPLSKSVLLFYGIWTLDFIRFVVPAFCINSKLQLIHVEFFGFISSIYLLLLIFLTWVCIELHGRNFNLFVRLWRPFHRCFVKLQRGWDKTSNIVDVFASFFLLSYVTLTYQAAEFFECQALISYTNDSVPRLKYVSNMFVPNAECKYHWPITISSALSFLIYNIIPILLLVFYPFKAFRVCLSKCKLERLFITIFVEKFHGCYRDGLDGGRDMRSFSGLYYVMIILLSLYSTLQIQRLHISDSLYYAFIFLSCALLIIIARPYKQKYMNISDTLLLSYAAITCILLSRNSFAGDETQIFIVLLIPSVIFGLVVVFKACNKLKDSLIKKCKCCYRQCPISNNVNSEENNETETLINPTRDYVHRIHGRK